MTFQNSVPREKARVIMYTRPGCHLCEEAKKAMESAGCQQDYTMDEINIESDPELLRRYRFDIPVVTINGEEAFRHYVNSADFKRRLKQN